MKIINENIRTESLYQEPRSVLREAIRKTVCDKHGLEGDATLDEMIDDIVDAVMNLEVI